MTTAYHNWQKEGWEISYSDEPEFCKSVNLTNLKEKDFSLVPSKYIEFIQRNDIENFDEKIKTIGAELKTLNEERTTLDQEIKKLFAAYGIEI